MKRKISIVLFLVLLLGTMPIFADDYVIKTGDVLWKIAAKYGMDYQTLALVNNIENPNRIYAGKKLNVNLVKKIDILTTNDFHGNLVGGSEAGGAKLGAYMDYYEAMNPQGTIILDAGDSFQGTPISNLLYGEPVVKFFNEVGYTATTIGNHEFDWGIETVLKTMKDSGAKYQMLTANVYKDGKLASWATPYMIKNFAGVKVGIIGISTPDTAVTAHKDYVGEYTFEDPIKITNALVPKLEAEGADLIIVLSHLGAKQNEDTKVITGELADFAKGVKGVDAVVGGHAHNVITGEVNNIPLIMASKNGRMIGNITLYYDTVTDKVVIKDSEVFEVRKGELTVEPNKQIQAMIDGFNKELAPVFNEVVGTLGGDMVRDYNTTSPAGNWFADVLRDAKDADVAFTNAGGIRIDVPAGVVTMEKVFEIMPFDNTPVTSVMTGKDIIDVLEQGCTLSKGMIQISGLTFTYDSTKPEYSRVLEVKMADGTLIDLAKEYTVVTNDFLAGGQDNFVTLGNFEWSNPYNEPLLRNLLAESIRSAGTLMPDTTLRAVDVAK